jgi:hypothetical protein
MAIAANNPSQVSVPASARSCGVPLRLPLLRQMGVLPSAKRRAAEGESVAVARRR